jgi:hypothetical protein
MAHSTGARLDDKRARQSALRKPASQTSPGLRRLIVAMQVLSSSMPSLIQTNAYLRSPARRARLLEENARDSSVFEGAHLPSTRAPHGARSSSTRTRIAAAKKPAKRA